VGHALRVAIADRPEGPFELRPGVLTPDERFAIDAHPFRDDDGQWYLYYARDVLEGTHVGTSLAVDRLVDMTTLAGDPRTVLRASARWQLYQAQRAMYGACMTGTRSRDRSSASVTDVTGACTRRLVAGP
jgi:hypothetical protein